MFDTRPARMPDIPPKKPGCKACSKLMQTYQYTNKVLRISRLIFGNFLFTTSFAVQSAAALEYTNCISADGYDPPNKCPGYHTKPSCPVGWGCRMHGLHLCRGVRPSQQVFWILHCTIWWGCSSLDALKMSGTISFSLFPGPLRPGVVVPVRVPCMGYI